jgi:hypothetical protein
MADNRTVADPTAEIAERALRKSSIVGIEGWDGDANRYVFVAPYDCHIDGVRLLSTDGVAASDTNYYAFQVRNLGAGNDLLSSAQTTQATGGQAIAADEPYGIGPDQNRVISRGDVLELQVTETGAATDLSLSQLLVVVEYT